MTIRPVDVFGFCQLAQRYGLSARQALALFRAAGLQISTSRFYRLWRAADAAEHSLAWPGAVKVAV